MPIQHRSGSQKQRNKPFKGASKNKVTNKELGVFFSNIQTIYYDL